MESKPIVYSADAWDVFNGRYASPKGITEQMYLMTRIQVGHASFDYHSDYQNVSISFTDSQGTQLFEIVPHTQPSSQHPRGQMTGGCCALVDRDGQQIVILEQRRSRPSEIKIKTPDGQRLFDVERELLGGLRGHFAGVDIRSNSTTRFHLHRDATQPFENPTYTVGDAQNIRQLCLTRMLPFDKTAKNGSVISASYQIDVFKGSDAALCALFSYLIHWAELRNLARQFERAAKAGVVSDLPDHLTSGSKADYKVEGPEGLFAFHYALRRGYKGQAWRGLDMLGGPYSVKNANGPVPSKTTVHSYSRLL